MHVPLRFLLPALAGVAWCVTASAANPFLSATDFKPVSARFKGTEWGDEIGAKELPLSARVVTTRIAQASWGAIFKISFEDIVSRAPNKREISPVYYIATDDRIVLLNDDHPEATAQQLAAQPKPPDPAEPNYVHGISSGSTKSVDGLTETNLTVKGNRCTYQWSHNSGHFQTIVWQKGLGLVEYAQGYGASKDGFRLKRGVGARERENIRRQPRTFQGRRPDNPSAQPNGLGYPTTNFCGLKCCKGYSPSFFSRVLIPVLLGTRIAPRLGRGIGCPHLPPARWAGLRNGRAVGPQECMP